MVGRLVEDEQSGRLGHRLCQRQTRALAAREHPDLALDRVVPEPEAGEIGAQRLATGSVADAVTGDLQDGALRVELVRLVLLESCNGDTGADLGLAGPWERGRRAPA